MSLRDLVAAPTRADHRSRAQRRSRSHQVASRRPSRGLRGPATPKAHARSGARGRRPAVVLPRRGPGPDRAGRTTPLVARCLLAPPRLEGVVPRAVGWRRPQTDAPGVEPDRWPAAADPRGPRPGPVACDHGPVACCPRPLARSIGPMCRRQGLAVARGATWDRLEANPRGHGRRGSTHTWPLAPSPGARRLRAPGLGVRRRTSELGPSPTRPVVRCAMRRRRPGRAASPRGRTSSGRAERRPHGRVA